MTFDAHTRIDRLEARVAELETLVREKTAVVGPGTTGPACGDQCAPAPGTQADVLPPLRPVIRCLCGHPAEWKVGSRATHGQWFVKRACTRCMNLVQRDRERRGAATTMVIEVLHAATE